MATLAAGRLRHRVSIEEPAETIDADGMRTKVWVNFADVWAAVEPLSAREFLAAQANQSAVIGKIIIRYRAGLRAAMRILFRGQYYDLAGIIPDNVSGLEWLTIPFTAGVVDNPGETLTVLDGGSPSSVSGGGFDGGGP